MACPDALTELDKCFEEQYNCIIGYGAWMNFYAGAYSEQPHPDDFSSKRFTQPDDIFKSPAFSKSKHVDWIIRRIGRHGHDTDYVNHLGYSSVLNHAHPDYERVFALRCPMEESLAGGKVIINRTANL